MVFHVVLMAAYALAFFFALYDDGRLVHITGPWSRAAYVLAAALMLGWCSGINVGATSTTTRTGRSSTPTAQPVVRTHVDRLGRLARLLLAARARRRAPRRPARRGRLDPPATEEGRVVREPVLVLPRDVALALRRRALARLPQRPGRPARGPRGARGAGHLRRALVDPVFRRSAARARPVGAAPVARERRRDRPWHVRAARRVRAEVARAAVQPLEHLPVALLQPDDVQHRVPHRAPRPPARPLERPARAPPPDEARARGQGRARPRLRLLPRRAAPVPRRVLRARARAAFAMQHPDYVSAPAAAPARPEQRPSAAPEAAPLRRDRTNATSARRRGTRSTGSGWPNSCAR